MLIVQLLRKSIYKTPTILDIVIRDMASKSSLTYTERARNHPNLLVRRLFEIAETKETNVTLSADLTTTQELLEIADGKLASK